MQRKVITPNDFPDLGAVGYRLTRFAERYNAAATPFRWCYTRTDLRRHLQRLDGHDRLLDAA